MKLKNTKLLKAMWGNRKLYAAGALLPLLATLSVNAAEEINEAKKNVENKIEVISISGTRSSLINARNIKEGSEQISDSYFAEDIGKSADESIGAAMQRIPGISIDANPTSDGGAGTQGKGSVVSVRGMRPELNQIFMNGVPLTSGLNNQAVDLSIISADVLSQIEVIKSSRAKDEEGSLGGNVYLSSISPLAQGESKTVITAEGRYNDLSESTSPRFVVSTVQQSDDDKFGFAGSFYFDANDEARSDQFESWDWAFPVNVAGARSQATGEFLEPNAGRVIGEPVTDTSDARSAIGYISTRYNNYVYDESKAGGNVTFEYRPDDVTEIRFDAVYSKQSLDYTLDFLSPGAPRNTNPGGIGSLAGYTFLDEHGDVAEMYDPTGLQNTSAATSLNEGEVDTLALGLDFTREIGDWSLHAKVTSSDSSRKDFLENVLFADGLSDSRPYLDKINEMVNDGVDLSDPRAHCGVYMANGSQENLPVPQSCVANDPFSSFAGYRLRKFFSDETETTDSKQAGYFDVSNLALELGPITGVHAGVKYTARDKESTHFKTNFNFPLDGGDSYIKPNDPRFTLNNVATGFLGGIGPNELAGGWVIPDRDEVTEYFGTEKALAEAGRAGWTPNTWQVTEDTYGAYLQVDFELDKLSGNFGVRYAHTEVSGISSGSMKFAPDSTFNGTPYADLHPDAVNTGIDVSLALDNFNESNSYDNILPSLNVNYEITDDLILRAAVSRTLARPTLSSLVPGVSVDNISLEQAPSGKIGSASLDPFTSDNFDLSLEWYFNDVSMLTAGYFSKDIDSFAYKTTVKQNFENLITGEDCMVDRLSAFNQGGNAAANAATVAEYGCTDVEFATEVNGATAKISGYELGYTQMYDFLPGVLQYLGFAGNYTYVDSAQDLDPDTVDEIRDGMNFENTSKHTVNSTLFWENEDISLRLAHNYRSPSVKRSKTFGNSIIYTDSMSTLAFSANYTLDNLQFTFSVDDIFDSYNRTYMIAESEGNPDIDKVTDHRTSSIYHNGRTFRLGARYTF